MSDQRDDARAGDPVSPAGLTGPDPGGPDPVRPDAAALDGAGPDRAGPGTPEVPARDSTARPNGTRATGQPDSGVPVADVPGAGVPADDVPADEEPAVERSLKPVPRPGAEVDDATELLTPPPARRTDVGEATVFLTPSTPGPAETGLDRPGPAERGPDRTGLSGLIGAGPISAAGSASPEGSDRLAGAAFPPVAAAEPATETGAGSDRPAVPIRPADRRPDRDYDRSDGPRSTDTGPVRANDGAAVEAQPAVGVPPRDLAPDGAQRAGAAAATSQVAPWKRLSSAGALIGVLIALFGFTLVVQLRSNDTDQGLAATRQEDLVAILSDLEARETRLNSEIAALEESQRQLSSGVEGEQAALAEADRRANELGLLAGTLPGRGPGLEISITAGSEPIKASAILNTVQELRGAGGEVMQLAGADGTAVRVIASSAFVDADGGVVVDGTRLTSPYLLTVIGAPQTMDTALRIPGGVVASVGKDGGTVNPLQRKAVEVTAVREATNLQYARPVS